MARGKMCTGPADWALRAALRLCTHVSIPLYLWFLHHMGGRRGQQLPADDNRPWLPIVVPLPGFSLTTLSSTPW
ncbi:hypothetical protein [Streptomyces sp. G45]|uniref:hypothetical protein n=1 Tax=Streptomyces sp. G45 TaxID=3406627 RepID=UPI003C193B14